MKNEASDGSDQNFNGGNEINSKVKYKDHMLVRPRVDLLMQNSKEFYGEFSDIIDLEQILTITIDFQDVSFVDSSGAGAIIRIANAIRLKGKILYIVNLNKNLSSVFRLSGFHRLMKILSYEEYIDSFPEMTSVMK